VVSGLRDLSSESLARQTGGNKSMRDLDPHGQPYSVQFNRARRTERDLSELLGLAKGMLADGAVDPAEAEFLRNWGRNHPDALAQWPTDLIFARLNSYFADGKIDEVERRDLHDLLAALVGGTISLVLGYEASTALPLDHPAPALTWGDRIYVFTGRFAYGPRRDCQREITKRGGACEGGVTRRTNYLVIGTFGSRDWAQTSYGRKIQKAVKLRDSGCALRIVGEDHWVRALEQ
jgi:NAD-dependent DNA ligase